MRVVALTKKVSLCFDTPSGMLNEIQLSRFSVWSASHDGDDATNCRVDYSDGGDYELDAGEFADG